MDQVEEKPGIADSYNYIGAAYIKLKKYNDADVYMHKALSLSNELGSLGRIEAAYASLASLDSARGRYDKALEYYKLFIVTRDSLTNEENTKKIVQQQMQYDFDKVQVADSLQFAREKEVGVLKLQRQKTITYTGFAGAGLTLLFLYVVYQSYQKQRLANHQLKEAQDQLIKTEKMAAFGIMASRVSHEILNPLNFVNNFSELSEEIVSDLLTAGNEEQKKEIADILISNLKKIQEHGMRASDIVKQLQEHSLKGSAHEFFEENQR